MFLEFKAKIKKLGLAKANRYQVIINNPLANDTEFTRTLSLMCESTELPSKGFSTTDANIYGPTFKKPYNTLYTEMPFVFLVPNDMKIKNFFEDWMNKVIDPNTNDSFYYNEYITDIQINQLDNKNEVIYSVRLKEAYPITMNALPLDNASPNTFHKLAMTFTFKTWERLI